MKKVLIALLLALALVAPTAEAGIVTGDIIVVDYGAGGYGGGPFWVLGPSSNNFWTFCLERGRGFRVRRALQGCRRHGSGRRRLRWSEPRSARCEERIPLYQVPLNAMPSLDWRIAYQSAIWNIEQEFGNPSNYDGIGTPTIRGYADQLIADANANAKDVYPVRVMQLWSCDTNGRNCEPRQDMLVQVPDGGATLMLLGGGLIGLAALRRKLGR